VNAKDGENAEETSVDYAAGIAAAQEGITAEIPPNAEIGARQVVDQEALAATIQGLERKDQLLTETLRKLQAKNTDRETTTKLRSEYAGKAYKLASRSILFWVVIVGFQGISHLVTDRAPLSDAVLIAITTGCTVNVLAAFLGVIRGLFPSASKAKGRTPNKGKKSKDD
jgi:hypothetical protein